MVVVPEERLIDPEPACNLRSVLLVEVSKMKVPVDLKVRAEPEIVVG